uniref:Protein kinase domain-containing protein n=1 Tax=Oryzias latipes TaxID=8090 RepID=A0A3P9HJU3_ORYLA
MSGSSYKSLKSSDREIADISEVSPAACEDEQSSDSSLNSSSWEAFGESLESLVSDGEIVDMIKVLSTTSEDEQSSHSTDSRSSWETFGESLESLVSDGEIVDMIKVLSTTSEDEQSSHSSLNSSSSDSFEKPVFQENLEKTEVLQTDKNKAKKSSGRKKEKKSFGVKKGQLLVGNLGTYRVEKFLGEGNHGKVTKCSKLGSQEMFAIKILEDVNEGKEESEAMKLIEDLDPDENNLIKFYECFSYKNVICLVYEILDECLCDCLEDDDPTDLCNIRAIALQMFQALHALKSVGVVHGDIKLDNIMFAEKESLRIKLIDFGFAMKAKNLLKGTNIQVTPFRAPEVLLGLPLDESIDMWGLGVVLSSLYYGNYPFPSETEYETIRAMVQIFGWRLLTPDEYTQDTGEELEDRILVRHDEKRTPAPEVVGEEINLLPLLFNIFLWLMSSQIGETASEAVSTATARGSRPMIIILQVQFPPCLPMCRSVLGQDTEPHLASGGRLVSVFSSRAASSL